MAGPRYYVELKVTGRGVFPFDMLRFGSLYPVDGESAARLDVDRNDRQAYREPRTLRLACYCDNPISADQTVERFRSFLWAASIDRQTRL